MVSASHQRRFYLGQTAITLFGLICGLGIRLTTIAAAQEFDLLRYLEGTWECRTLDSDQNNLHKPNIVTYIRGTSPDSLYGDVGEVSVVYKRHVRSGKIIRMDLYPVPSRIKVIMLIGAYDAEKNCMNWRTDGKMTHVWKFRGKDQIEIEVLAPKTDPDAAESRIPDDDITNKDRRYIWRKLTERKRGQ